MKKDSKFISRQDAALVLGVNPQTISNYVDKGYITSRTSGGVTWIDRESFYKMKEEIKVNVANEEELRRLNAICIAKEKEVQMEIDKAENMIEGLREFRGDLLRALIDMLDVYIHRCCSEREKLILGKLLEMNDNGYQKYHLIGNYLSLTAERVRQLAGKAIRKSGEMMLAMDVELEEKTKRIEELEQQVEMLNVSNVKLMSEVDSCKYDYVYKDEWLGTTSIENNDRLSVRSINVIRSHSDSVDMTMYELIQKPLSEVRRWRNSGKKTLAEMIDLLDAHGYRFGMNRDELLVKVKREDEHV